MLPIGRAASSCSSQGGCLHSPGRPPCHVLVEPWLICVGCETGGVERLEHRLYRSAHLTGSFVLRSGTLASEYFDKFQFTSDPRLLAEVAEEMARLVPAETDVLAGLELGGVPLAAALALKTGLPAAYVRKDRKTYATEKLAEGPPIDGRRVLVVDDVLTTGGAVLDAVPELRAEGAIVTDALLVIDRESGGRENLAAAGVTLHALFTMNDLRPGQP